MSEADDRAGRFLRLVGTGDLEGVRTALARAPELVNAIGPHPFWGGRPQPLHVAIETGRREMIDLLLDAGADVSGANGQYHAWSPLMLAIQRRRDGLPDVLRQRGARIGVVEALMLGDDELVGRLLQPGPSVLPSPPPSGGSLLSFARTTFAIDRLLALGVSPDDEGPLGDDADRVVERPGRRGPAAGAAPGRAGRRRPAARLRAARRSADARRHHRSRPGGRARSPT